jgi:hypothetical protein
MRAPYLNANLLPKEGDEVYKHHLYDGTPDAGKVITKKTYKIVKLHSVPPQVNACWDRTYAELDDGSFEYVWNLSVTDKTIAPRFV